MRVADFLIGSIPLIIEFYAKQYLQDDLSKSMTELESEFNIPKTKTYDFIIVGGGSAGCVLAGRLSENFNVLLLEAGGDPPPVAAVPHFASSVAANPTINYFFKSVPMTNASEATGGVVTSHTGKMLGGSGSHNDMVHSRGNPKDYDNWATLTNDPSWNYENVIEYFKKSENFIAERFGPETDAKYYGKDGPITVTLNKSPILDLWFEAGKELGYEINDPNGFQTESFTPMNNAVENGQRSSSYTEYVLPYENTRTTLTVIRYANVSDILLNTENQAYGVAYTRHGLFPQIAHASKEIIVSAGAFSSALLLMKSGIGPVKMLEEAEIPVKVPLQAVGENLSDHPGLLLSGFSVNDTTFFPKILSSEIEQLMEQYHKGEGILTLVGGAETFKVSKQSEHPQWPNLWIEIYPHVIVDDSEPTVSFIVVLGRPKSRGVLSLNTEAYKNGTRDDVQLALIDYKFLSDPAGADVEAMLEGINFVFEIVETGAMRGLNLTYNETQDSSCIGHEFLSDNYWRCFIRQRTLSWVHMVGTNSMGPESGNSNTTVVDNQLRVRGVKGLRVVDASVIPAVTNANLNAPVLMLAEKAADLITQEWSTGAPNKGTFCFSNINPFLFIAVFVSIYFHKLLEI